MFILDTIYDDYEIAYRSNINENLIPMLILLGILGILVVIYFISMMKIYRKANRSGISAIIPFYNIIVLLEIINESRWKFILFLIPIFNIFYFFITMYKLARYFRKSKTYSLLCSIFSLIMIPILSFSDSEYIGINEEAMSGVSVAKDLPVETEKKPTLSNPDQPMKERTKVSMSIGGGVYQKEYRDSLLEAKNVKETKKLDVADFRVDTSEFMTQPEGSVLDSSLLQNVDFIETPNQEATQVPNSNENILAADATVIPSIDNAIIPTVDTSIKIKPNQPFNLLANSSNENLSVIPSIDKKESSEFIDNSSPIVNKPLNDNINSNALSFVATPVDAISTNVTENTSIFAPLPEEQQVTTPNSNISFQIDPAIQGLNDQSLREQAEFIACPHCGAKVKNGAPKCFMCGKEL